MFNDDTMAIMIDLYPVLRTLYIYYFEEEQLAAKSGKFNTTELKKASLDSCFSFLKDFELSPMVLHKKTCFAVWHSVQETINSPNQI